MIACGTVLLSIAGLDEDVDRDSSRLVLIVVAFLLQKGGGRSVNQGRNVVARYGFVSFGCREVTRTTTYTSPLEDF